MILGNSLPLSITQIRPLRLVGHVSRYEGNRPGAQDRSSLFLTRLFGRTVITLQTPPVTHGPRGSSVQVDCTIAACAFA